MPLERSLQPLRSLLFLPATAEHLLPKATERGADALVVDLEDSIPPDRKSQARPMAARAIEQLADRGARVVLRINSEAEQWQQDLVAMPVHRLAAMMLPKVESLEQIALLDQAVSRLTQGQPVPLVALVETPRGILSASELASHPALCALGFGAEDYAGALGVPAAASALAWPASQVITCAHANGLQCWGLAASIAEVVDMQAFGQSVREARAMGFTGSVCIHPRQVPVVNAGFTPSADEMEWARRVLAADQEAQAAGRGAVLLDGRMIDRPIVARARRWLANHP